MSHTKIYIVVAVVLGIAWFLNRKTRLTFDEKKTVLIVSVLAFPVVGFASYWLLSDMHGEAYRANDPGTGTGGADSALAALSWLLGGASSLLVLGFADRVQRARTEEHFAQLEAQAVQVERQRLAMIEQARRDDTAAAQLRLETQLKLEHTKQQTLMTAVAVNQRQFAAQEAEQLLFKAFQDFCARVNVFQHKTEDQLRDEFRHELARRAIPKLNLRELEGSANPDVQRLLRRPNLKLAPDDERNI